MPGTPGAPGAPGTLGELAAVDYARGSLEEAGHAPEAAARISDLVDQCARALREAGVPVDAQSHAVFAPGRIEVLGKHTDYAGGRSLLTALGHGFCLVASAREDGRFVLHDIMSRGRVELPVKGGAASQARWAIYPATVVERVRRDFPGAERGANIAFVSDLPSAAGMSSSSAFVTATFLALSALNALDDRADFREVVPHREALADYLGAVENGRAFGTLGGGRGVGTRGGSQDHVAILCSRPGRLVQYRFRPVRLERTLTLPAGFTFVVASSGVRAPKGGAARSRYNRISDRARKLEAIWGEADASLGDILASDPDAPARLRNLIRMKGAAEDLALLERLDQFVAESFEIIPAACDSLDAGDLDAFGLHVDRSQRLAERVLLNQVDETVLLQRAARDLGAVAASAFGAGFGGSVWALVQDGSVDTFMGHWKARYLSRFPRRRGSADFMLAPPGPAALRIL